MDLIEELDLLASIENHGSLQLVRPRNEEVREWLAENTAGTWWCGALVVEPRYLDDLLMGMAESFLPEPSDADPDAAPVWF